MVVTRIIKKYKIILSNHEQKRILQLIFLMVIGGLLETCSVSLILPFMNMVMDSQSMMKNNIVNTICEFMGINDDKTLLIFFSIILALIYIIKNIYLLFEFNVQYRFVNRNMFSMQCRLLNNYINNPYEFFLSASSSEIIRVVSVDTGQTFVLLTTLLSFLTEIIVSSMLIVTVFLIAPIVTLMMAIILGLMVLTITNILKPILRVASVEEQKAYAGMTKWLLQSIQGIKELKVAHKEDFFEANFNTYGKKYINATRKYQILALVPRFLIEAISMSSMFIVVAILIGLGTDISTLVPVISAIAVAAMRLLPSVNRISSALAAMNFGEAKLDKLIENLRDIKEKDSADEVVTPDFKDIPKIDYQIDKFTKSIKFNNITYSYPDSETPILEDAYFEIKKGQSIGIVGASGAGKTTSVDIILGLLNPSKGNILVDDKDINEDKKNWLSQIGYIPQMIFMLDDTIKANVAFGEEKVADEAVWRALKEASLEEFVKSLPDGINTQIGERGMRLSGGQRQRIGIARALYNNPDILFFDEATSALDNETEKAIMESINNLKGEKTMIIIAHRLTTIENCDAVYKVENGKITLVE